MDKDIADEIFNLWLEYEAGTSLEAKIAKQFDKLDMIVQADTYESEKNMELDSFFESTKDSFSHPEVSNFCCCNFILVMFILHFLIYQWLDYALG